MKKVAHATEESGALVGGVASYLYHPLGGGMFGQTGCGVARAGQKQGASVRWTLGWSAPRDVGAGP
jgi:hypothetical protein